MLWDAAREAKVYTTEDAMQVYMRDHPACEYYTGQRPRPKRSAAQLAAFDLCVAAPAKVQARGVA